MNKTNDIINDALDEEQDQKETSSKFNKLIENEKNILEIKNLCDKDRSEKQKLEIKKKIYEKAEEE